MPIPLLGGSGSDTGAHARMLGNQLSGRRLVGRLNQEIDEALTRPCK